MKQTITKEICHIVIIDKKRLNQGKGAECNQQEWVYGCALSSVVSRRQLGRNLNEVGGQALQMSGHSRQRVQKIQRL